MLSIASLALGLVGPSTGLALDGPAAGILQHGDSVFAIESDEKPVEVRWVRNGAIVTRAFCVNYGLADDAPLRIVRNGGDRFLTFWTHWATGYARAFVLMRDDPPRLQVVGKFENGTLEGFELSGRVWEFPRLDSKGPSMRLGRNVWVGNEYQWSHRARRFVKMKTRYLSKLPAESQRRFRH